MTRQTRSGPVVNVELVFPKLPMFPNMQIIPRLRNRKNVLHFRKLPPRFGRKPGRVSGLCFACLMILAASLCGCTSFKEYIQNGFKVGPNYCPPSAPVAQEWIDANDKRVRTDCDDLSKWWTVFNDPGLDALICCAYRQNLTLREAGCRVLEARAQLGITTGQIFPQSQTMTGSYTRNAVSREVVSGQAIVAPFFNQWNYGFNLNWELDFWGRFRRAIESDAANLNASVEDYDDVLVTLLGDVATNYVADAHFRGANQVRPGQRAIAARDLDDYRSPLQRRHDQRVGRLPGAKHLGANRGPDSRVGDQPPANGQPTMHLVGHAAGRVAVEAWPRAYSHHAARGGHRHPGRLVAPPPRRPPRRTFGGGPVRTDRRGGGRLLSGHLDQRHARIFGRAVSRPLPLVGPQWKCRALPFSGTS